MKKSRVWSFAIIIFIYLVAVAAGAGVLVLIAPSIANPIAAMLVADIAATIVVFVFSLIFKNASVYDAYWSVAPVFIILGFYAYYDIPFAAHQLFVLLPLLFWAIRLTYNWAHGFPNLEWEDWRYKKFRTQHPKLFPVISLGGIMMMPTLVVFFSVAPMWWVINSSSLSLWHIVGGAIILLATMYQATADKQMRRFRRENTVKGACIDTGLWRHSRHPNYFGEIMVWLGVGLSSLGHKVNPSLSSAFAGFLIMFLLFTLVSIPLMEKHILSSRPAYAEYKKIVASGLVPWKRKTQTYNNIAADAFIEPQQGETENV